MAATKISGLPAQTVLKDADLLPTVDDPTGVDTTKKITALNARKYFSAYVNVRDYGAKGDCRTVLDGVITGGALSTLTSATAAFTSADQGKVIVVHGAAAAGAHLVTTIATFTNSTTVQLTAAATTAVSGSLVNFGTDDSAAINAALAAAGVASVFFPPGLYACAALIAPPANATNMRIQGAGTASRLIAMSIRQDMCWASSGPATFEDLTFDANYLTQQCVSMGNTQRDITFRRCIFKNALNNHIYSFAMNGLKVVDCDFLTDNGQNIGQGVQFSEGGTGLVVKDCTFDFVSSAVLLPAATATPAYSPRVEDNKINGHWWQLPYSVANSGGTVTYTANTVVDSSAPFTSYVSGYTAVDRVARVLIPVASGSGGTVTYPWLNRLADTAANFSAVKPGWLVRTATAWAAVERVDGATVWLQQWYLNGPNTWGTKTGSPVDGTAYTLYEVIQGRVQAITSTTLSINVGWCRLADGSPVTPSAGSLYELLVRNGGGRGIFFAPGTHGGSMQRNQVEATFLEGLFNWGSGTRIIGNQVRFGQDHGITTDSGGSEDSSGCVIANNHVTSPGAAGIEVISSDCVVVGNLVESPNVGYYAAFGGLGGAPGIAVAGNRNVVEGNRITNDISTGWSTKSVNPQYGITVSRGATDNQVNGNKCTGFPGGAVHVTADGTGYDAGPNNDISGNSGGVISTDGPAPQATDSVVIATRPGNVTVETAGTTKTPRWVNRTDKTFLFTGLSATVDTAPATTPVVATVWKNGVATGAQTITISPGGVSGVKAKLAISIAPGEYLQAWPTAIGTGTVGSDLSVVASGSSAVTGFSPRMLNPLAWFDVAKGAGSGLSLADQMGGPPATLAAGITGATSPTWNGTYLTFDGVANSATLPTTAIPPLNANHTIVVVCRYTTNTLTGYPALLMWFPGSPPRAGFYLLRPSGSPNNLWYFGGNGSVESHATSAPSYGGSSNIRVISGESATGLLNVRVNGSNTGGSGVTQAMTTPGSGTPVLGNEPSGGSPFNGDIFAVLTFPWLLTAGEYQTLVSYYGAS